MSFYDKREIKEWIGLVTRTEHVYFERWHIPISVPLTNASSTLSTPGGGDVDVATAYRTAYDCVTKGMMAIIEVSLFPFHILHHPSCPLHVNALVVNFLTFFAFVDGE